MAAVVFRRFSRGTLAGTLAATLCALLLCFALSQFAAAGLIHGKAWLAPKLMERAFERAATVPRDVKPWPWADTYPAARLRIGQINLSHLVMAGDHGNALAFGPGMASGARPGQPGLTMISAHRDTHFRRLAELRRGDAAELLFAGEWHRYRVREAVIADARVGQVPAVLPTEGLLLVTCYPFDAIVPGGPLRYVVIAEKVSRSGPGGTSTL